MKKLLLVAALVVCFNSASFAEPDAPLSCSATISFACAQPSVCIEYATLPDGTTDEAKLQCENGGGTVSATCSRDNLVASCAAGYETFGFITYYYSPMTRDVVQMICAQTRGTLCN